VSARRARRDAITQEVLVVALPLHGDVGPPAFAPLAIIVGGIAGSLLAAVIGKTGGSVLAAVSGLVVALYALLVMSRVGVSATSDGVLLRGYVRNRQIDWQDVDRFEEDTRPWRAHVVLVSGERVKLTGLGPSWFLFRDHTLLVARRQVADLNAIRAEVSSGGRRE
jgi:hypothetical protein